MRRILIGVLLLVVVIGASLGIGVWLNRATMPKVARDVPVVPPRETPRVAPATGPALAAGRAAERVTREPVAAPRVVAPAPVVVVPPVVNRGGKGALSSTGGGGNGGGNPGNGAGAAEVVPEEVAREALAGVGADPDAEKVWMAAINDPALSADARQNLIEDLNEDGFADPKNVTADDLPLIEARIALLEQIGPDAIDETNLAAFNEAYKDLVNMREKVVAGK